MSRCSVAECSMDMGIAKPPYACRRVWDGSWTIVVGPVEGKKTTQPGVESLEPRHPLKCYRRKHTRGTRTETNKNTIVPGVHDSNHERRKGWLTTAGLDPASPVWYTRPSTAACHHCGPSRPLAFWNDAVRILNGIRKKVDRERTTLNHASYIGVSF